MFENKESESMGQELGENPEVSEEKPAVDVEAMMSRLEKLEATNTRLLDESKAWKSKYQSAQDQKQKEEQIKLEESENWKELFEMEKNKNHELNSALKTTKKDVLQKSLVSEVAMRAKDAYDVKDVIAAMPRDVLSIDEDSMEIKGIDEAFAAVRESKPYLFDSKKVSGQNSARPEAMIPKEKSFEEAFSENPQAMLKDALAGLMSN